MINENKDYPPPSPRNDDISSCAKEEDEFSDTRTEEVVADSTSSEITISVDYDDGWIINEYSY